MLKLKTQKRVARLRPSAQPFYSGEDELTLLSNMLYPRRGAIVTCDGSVVVDSPAVSGETTGHGTFLAFGILQPLLSQLVAVCLQNAPNSHLAVPTGLAASSVISGTWAAATYQFEITAVDGSGNETTVSASASITLSDSIHGIKLTWNAVTNAIGYNIYQNVSGTYFLINGAAPGTTITFLAAQTIGTHTPALSNTTQQVVFRNLTTLEPYNDTTIIQFFPSSPISNNGFPVFISQYSPSGGEAGAMGPLPQLVSFANGVVLALGNTLPPLFWTGSGTAANLTNGFTAAFPVWVASASYPVGSIVQPTAANGFFYQAVQGGVSGTTQPTFPTTIGQRVAEATPGTVIWINAGVTTIVAPRGAGHSLAHGNFLYLFNTQTLPSSDGLDGPSVLKQSELGNPNSWNPQNTVVVGSNDAQEGMGMAVFTVAEAGIAPFEALLLFKNFSTYVMQGYMPFQSLSQVKTDKGCIAPRSIQYVAELQGVMRLTHQGFSVTDGISDEVTISDDIQPYVIGKPKVPGITAIDQNFWQFSQSVMTATPSMYCCACPMPGNNGKLSRLFCFDVIQKVWTVIDLPFFVYAMFQVKPTAYSTILQTQLGGWTDGIVRRWQAGDSTWDTAAQVAWSATSDTFFGDDPSNRTFIRNIVIRGSRISSPITFTALVQTSDLNVPVAVPRVYQFPSGEFELEVPVGVTVLDAVVQLSGTGQVEIDTISWQTEEKPVVPQWNCP